jgi:glucose-1-phosphate cytidylyltransferase
MPRAVILAGGLGSRLSEETVLRPKPLVEIGDRPIIWHIMKIYAAHGITEFVVCLGYRGYAIKEYFANYFLHNSDVVVDTGSNSLEIINRPGENWKIWLIDTGAETNTGGRIKRVLDYVGGDEFCLTYGDGVGDVDITALLQHHRQSGRLATVTAVQMPGRFGSLKLDGSSVSGFEEKPHGDAGWINGGFFVLSPAIGRYIEGDSTVWERDPMEALARDGQLSAYFHDGFWQPMDTLRDKRHLDELWNTGKAQWKVWD